MNKAKSVINLGENAIVLVIGRNNPLLDATSDLPETMAFNWGFLEALGKEKGERRKTPRLHQSLVLATSKLGRAIAGLGVFCCFFFF